MFTYDGPIQERLPDTKYEKYLEISHDQFPFSSDVYVYDNKVSFAHTTDRIGGIIIESKPISDTLRSIFEFTWHMHTQK
jgi:hypothetical protein